MTSVRQAFLKPGQKVKTKKLNAESLKYLSTVMGRTYTGAGIQISRRLSFQKCTAGPDYSAFNMGGGESSVIQLLHLAQEIPDGGILLVEEIDAALHPEAQKRLAAVLVDICRKKKLQIICTSHSEVFIDSLPREARLLLRRTGDHLEVMESPSTRFAVYEMTGVVQPELLIYCEDDAAAILIKEAVPYDQRCRIKVQDIGDKATVVRQGISHLRGEFNGTPLCVLDGDCTEAEVQKWIRAERGEREHLELSFAILPGDNLPPEIWLAKQIDSHNAYLSNFQKQLGCTQAVAKSHVAAMLAEPNHHDIAFRLAERIGGDIDNCKRILVRSVVAKHPALRSLRDQVIQILG